MKIKKIAPIIYVLFFWISIQADTTSLEYEGVFKPLYNPGSSSSIFNKHYHNVLDTTGKIEGAKDSLHVDFEGRQVTYTQLDTATGIIYNSYHYNEMTQYFDDMYRQSLYDLWRSGLKEPGRAGRERRRDSSKIVFQAPVHLPRWAKRIVGDEPPKLSISGVQKLKVGFKSSKRGEKSGGQQDKHKEPIFQPSTEFSIKGTVGRLLELEIRLKGNKKEGGGYFDDSNIKKQLDEIKIHYHSDSAGELEDDIIQEVIIGKTSFSMPGLGLIGYPSGGDGGLFGVKIRSKVGPLDLTTIASIENVENEEREIDLSSGSSEAEIDEKQFIKRKFFFLDTMYRALYVRKHSPDMKKQYMDQLNLTEIPTVVNLRIFKKIDNVKNVTADMKYVIMEEVNSAPAIYQELSSNKDYFLNTRDNFVRLEREASSRDNIVFWAKLSNGAELGSWIDSTYELTPGQIVPVVKGLRYLKRNNMQSTNPEYHLMLRNVYSIKRGDGSDFTFDIYRKSEDGTLNESNDDNKKFSDIFKLTKDGIIDKSNSEIFDHENGHLYIPPFFPKEGENGAYPFTLKDLGTNNTIVNTNPDIYADENIAAKVNSKFKILTSSSEKRNEFSLGFGIKENSEKIWNGSDTLQKNIDYTISYFSGTVELISSKAKSYTKVKATYQKESLFLLDKKVLFGVNGMLKFPNIGRNSYLSTTLMWQRMNAKSITPKIGTEPFNRFAVGANLLLDFEPDWMTRAVNRLPGIETEAKSTARFSFEIAHSSVKNSAKNGGRAYIDNFSTSEQNLRLESLHSRWFRASMDFEDVRDSSDPFQVVEEEYFKNIPAWEWYWYKPLQEDEKEYYYNIYPKPTDTTSSTYREDDKISTLKMVVRPFPGNESLMQNIDDAINDDMVTPWAGIMRGLNGRLTKREDDRYFEFWLNVGDAKGELLVDFGQISEDLTLDGSVPNNVENYEKFTGAPTQPEDLGIDATDDTLEYWCFPRYDAANPSAPWSWDTLKYKDSRLGDWAEDPHRDNWKRYDTNDGNNANKRWANGSENSNSRYDVNFVKGETEDFNEDGKFINVRSSRFFRYRLPLDYDVLTGETFGFKKANNVNTKWVKVRLPISVLAKDFNSDYIDTVDNPSWEYVEQVRFLWKDMTESYSNNDSLVIEFADMQFVGNQWAEFLDLAGKDDDEQEEIYKSAGKVTATIINTKKDGKGHLPYNMEYDSISNEEQANHTLLLGFDSVAHVGDDDYTFTAVERKFDSRYSTMNFSPYEYINLMIADMTDTLFKDDGDTLWFTFRFGSSDSSYYEYRKRIAYEEYSKTFHRDSSWSTKQVYLKELTNLKLAWFNVHGERADSIDTSKVFYDSDGEVEALIRIYSSTKMAPSLATVSWMSFGLLTNSDEPYSGQIMLNNFQTGGLRDYKGTAMKTGVDLKWADLLDNNIGFKYQDARFRSMSDDVHKQSNSVMDGGFSSDLYLDKFMPGKWGVRLPVGGSANATLSRPEIRPNSDIYLHNEKGEADGFSDMSKDFLNLLTKPDAFKSELTEAEKYQTERNNYRFYTSYKKTKDSKNPVVNLTADRIEIAYDYSEESNRERMGLIPEEERAKVTSVSTDFHEKTVDRENQNFKLSYDLSPNRKLQNKLKVKPFKKLENRKVRKIEFKLLPEKVKFGLLDIDYSRTEENNTIDEVTKTNYNRIIKQNMGLDHSFELRYNPISPLFEITTNLGIKRNFERYLHSSDEKAIDVLLSESIYDFDNTWRDFRIFENEENRSRKIDFKLTPNFNDWLSVTMKMNTDYNHEIDLADSNKIMKNDIGNDVSISTTLQTKRLLDKLAEFQKRRNKKKKEVHKDQNKDDKESASDKKKEKEVLFKRMAKGLDKINFERLKFSYDASMDLKSSYLETSYFQHGMDDGMSYYNYLKYSMGLYGRGGLGNILRGDMNDDAFGGVQNRNGWWGTGFQKNDADRRNTSQKFSVSSSFDLPKPLDLKFNTLSLRWSRNYDETPKTTRFDTTVTWPEVKVGMKSSVLEKVGEIKRHFRNLNLSTAFNYDLKTQHISDYWDESDSSKKVLSTAKLRYTTGYGFRPLFKLDGTLKKRRIDLSYSMDLYFDTTHTDEVYFSPVSRGGLEKKTRYEDSEKGVEKNHKWSVSYKKKGKKGKKIKIFKNKEIKIKGDVEYKGTMGLLVENTRKYVADINHERENEEDYRDRTFTLEPSVTYQLTDKVSCQLYYQMHRKLSGLTETINNKDEVAGEITIKF